MRPWISALVLTLSSTVAASSSALAPNERGRGFREGANHHLGDDAFVASFARQPTSADAEALRMRAHLVAVRALLAGRPPTRPDLAATRTRMLGYLDDYIARGTTPANTHLPWRSPVFIDDGHHICAVGYLIERSAGRALAENVADAHRYDYLEDIAAATPAVRAWIEASGFTLEELASIQPGYTAPIVETWKPWAAVAKPDADGPFDLATDEGEAKGRFRAGQMDGTWVRLDADKKVVGTGTLSAGAGTWRSDYADGSRMAEGPYKDSRPHGLWHFYHRSGNVAAVGRFDHGVREGAWQFFQDEASRVPLAQGSFAGGRVSGPWHHYDADGALLAVSSDDTPPAWRDSFGGYLLDIVPGEDGVHHWVHQGNIAGDHHRLDMFFDGSEILYQHESFGEAPTYDAGGHLLTRVEGEWRAQDCGWGRHELAAAHAGDIATLHGYLYGEWLKRAMGGGTEGPAKCGAARPISARRAKHIDAMLGTIERVRALSPEFVRRLALGDSPGTDDAGKDAQDLAKVLASNMTWYVEWPHVDGRFIEVFKTLPGYAPSGS